MTAAITMGCAALAGGALVAPTALAAGAKTWYVSASATSDPACSDASEANPFRSVAAALACSRNGDTVKLGAGSFGGQFTVSDNVTLEGAGANKTTITDPH